MLVVIVLTVAATLFVTGRNSEEAGPDPTKPSPTTAIDTSEIASADDDGPVTIITEDPTCAAWTPIGDTLANEQSKGWGDRDPLIGSSEWTAGQRSQHEAVAQAMRSAADQTLVVAKNTPHRVMRELYVQSAAYWRKYADAVPNYSPADNHLAGVAISTSNALTWICSAIDTQSAKARQPFLVDAPPPIETVPLEVALDPQPFVSGPTSACTEWHQAVKSFPQEVTDWLAIDPNLPSSAWTAEQRAVHYEAALTMESNAAELQNIGIQSDSPTFQDFATLAAQYRRAYVSSIPSYMPADNYLASVASQLVAAIDEACYASER